ncbi:MAG: 50S ribosomal protein L10 [Candidatus Kerfeldbacteria bacterium]|nr:50S ribosomal protein L10 [Candidatus Kerfeldbacteria bacterium]
MAISRQSKTETLQSLADKFQRTKGFMFTHYQGLTVKDITELRRTLRQEDVELVVAKKTLLRKALAASGFNADLVDDLEGSVAIAFGFSDEIIPAKLLQKYAKDHPAVQLLGGVVGGQVLDATQAVTISKLPSRDELRGQLVWVLGSPLSGTVNVLAGTMRGLLNVLQALQEKQPAPTGA